MLLNATLMKKQLSMSAHTQDGPIENGFGVSAMKGRMTPHAIQNDQLFNFSFNDLKLNPLFPYTTKSTDTHTQHTETSLHILFESKLCFHHLIPEANSCFPNHLIKVGFYSDMTFYGEHKSLSIILKGNFKHRE